MQARRRTAVLLFAAAAVVLGTTAAHADDIGNNVDSTLDNTAEVMSLNVGGAAKTTTLYVTPRNGDNKNGCNLTGSTTLVASVSSSDPSVATVSPTSVTFTSCGDTPTLTVAPVGQGSASITVSQTSNNTGGTFTFGFATFAVNVAPPPNTAPTVVVGGVAPGAEYTRAAVPAATCAVTDAEDGPSSFAATLSAISGPYAANGYGSQTASCSYTDQGGLNAASSVTYSIVDTPPTVTVSGVTDGATYAKGSVPTATCDVTDAEDGPSSFPATLSAVSGDWAVDGIGPQTASCSYTDAGGLTAAATATYLIWDLTPPVVTYTLTPATPDGNNGWYRSDVTLVWTVSEPESPSSLVTRLCINMFINGDEPNAYSYCRANSVGGGASQEVTIKRDATAPTGVSFVGGPANGGLYFPNTVPAAPTCDASDATSGLDSCVVTGYSAALGTHTLTATATDRAGNSASATVTYVVRKLDLSGFYQPTDMSGVVNTVKNGSTVPLKFRVYDQGVAQTSTAVVKSFTQQKISCTGGTEDLIEELAGTGGTSLRYDTTGSQFIQNWKTPAAPGSCYRVTMTTVDDSTLVALFKLK